MKNHDITHLLKEAGKGEQEAFNELIPHVYDQLRDIAGSYIVNERPDHTYSKTDLVHEAFIKLFDYDKTSWQDRNHFFAIASKCMRQILIDHARKKLTEKRGGNQEEVTFIDQIMQQKEEASHLLDIDDALKKLEQIDNRLAELVEYRYFGEMSIENTAEVLNVSTSTVSREWQKARGWLYKELKKPLV